MSLPTVVAISSAVTSTAGLVFVGWSVRVLVLQMRTQSHQAIYAHQHEVDALIFQRIDLKPIVEGRRPVPPVTDPMYEDVMAAVELFLTQFEHVYAHADSMAPEVRAHLQKYHRDLAAGDAFREYLHGKSADWFSPGFLAYVGFDGVRRPRKPDAMGECCAPPDV